MDKESKQIIASNLAITAAILNLASVTKGQVTTSDFDDKSFEVYQKLLKKLYDQK